MNMTESCNEINELCNKINAEMPKTLEDVSRAMDKIQKDMLWNKVCSIERKLNIIIEMLGDNYGEK